MALGGGWEARAVGDPQPQPPARVWDQSAFNLSCLRPFLRISFVSGQEHVKGCAILDLREEVSRRTQGNAHMHTALLLKTGAQLVYCRAQASARRACQVFLRGCRAPF